MIGYFLFIVLFVFAKDNHCYDDLNVQCKKIVNTPFDSPDFNPVIEPETFQEETHDFTPVTEVQVMTFQEETPDFIPVTEPDPLPEETLESNDFETAHLPMVYLEHGILVKAYDLRLSLFPKNNTHIHEENNSITMEMKPNNFIFQIYS